MSWVHYCLYQCCIVCSSSHDVLWCRCLEAVFVTGHVRRWTGNEDNKARWLVSKIKQKPCKRNNRSMNIFSCSYMLEYTYTNAIKPMLYHFIYFVRWTRAWSLWLAPSTMNAQHKVWMVLLTGARNTRLPVLTLPSGGASWRSLNTPHQL